MTLPKILLITSAPPNQSGGNRHQLGPLVEKYASKIVWYSILPPRPGFDLSKFPVPYAHGYLLSRPKHPLKFVRNWLNFELWSRYLGVKAAQFGAEHSVSLVWAVVEPHTINAAVMAARRLGVPLAISVMDDPIASFRVGWHHVSSERHLRSAFGRMIRYALSHSVIGSSMADYYREQYGISATILYLGIDPASVLPQRIPDRAKTPLIIGSVGTIYPNHREEWEALVSAVRVLNTRWGAEKFRILHIGNLREEFISPEVEVTGWLEGDGFHHALDRCDLYVSILFFAQQAKLVSMTSFPTKVSSYIQAQRPIVALAPPYGSITRFVDDYQCGVACTVLDSYVLADKIETLLFQEGVYERALEGMAALKNIFTRQRFFQSFEAFIARALG